MLDEHGALIAAPPTFLLGQPVGHLPVAVLRAAGVGGVRRVAADGADDVPARTPARLGGAVGVAFADPGAAVGLAAVDARFDRDGEFFVLLLVGREQVAADVFGDGPVGYRVEAALGRPLRLGFDGRLDESSETLLAVVVAYCLDAALRGDVF